MPVLAIGHVPEFDRRLGVEVLLRDRVGVKEPLADDAGSLPHYIIRIIYESIKMVFGH